LNRLPVIAKLILLSPETFRSALISGGVNDRIIQPVKDPRSRRNERRVE
jgi:hypothetical protein